MKDMIGEMFKRGIHFGYSRSRRHPSVTPYIFGFKNRTAIVDLEKTVTLLESAKAFVRELGRSGHKIVFVGSKPEAREAVIKGALAINMPYVAERWIGGTFTNFGQIKTRIAKLKELTEAKREGKLPGETKRERAHSDHELSGLDRYFGSLQTLDALPKAIFVIDPGHEEIAVAEATVVGVPVVAVAGVDCNIKGIAYPIVGNDAQLAGIQFFVDQIVAAYKEGQTLGPVEVPVPFAVPTN